LPVPKEQLHIAVAIHGMSTAIVLNNAGYQKKYSVDNPNLALINQLKGAGVSLYVCGQSLLGNKYNFAEVNPDIAIGLSMLTVTTAHLMKGYSMLIF